jgi:uncharacterized protein YecT (DUF1311 family)
MTFASLLVLSLSLGCVAEAASPQDAKSKPVPTPPISSTAGKSSHHTPDYVLLKARHVGFKLKDGEAEKDSEDSQSQDQLYQKCIDESDGTSTAWAECGGARLEREDEKLNAVWKKLYAAASGQTKTDLLAEQRLWNTFKESSCDFYANWDWGRQGQVLEYPICRAEVIAARTKELEGYYSFIAER